MSKARGLADLGNVYNDGALSNRNLVINGAMQVAQRGTSAAGVSGNGYYGCDRWSLANGSLGTWDITQEADGPEGFGSSFKVAAATAVPSPVAAGTLFAQYKFEGQDVQQLKKGTSNALPLTLSFWVKSDKTGTYQVNVRDTSAVRQISATYTVDVSGTWEYKTITFDGDTSGVLANDNTDALRVEWWLASGTNFTSGAAPTAWEAADNTDRNAGSNVNLADTIGNYWQITGVQLEVGDTATPFEHRSYGQELALCQRYYEKLGDSSRTTLCAAAYYSATEAYGALVFETKRASPTVAFSSQTDINVYANGAALAATSISSGETKTNSIRLRVTTSTATVGVGAWYELTGPTAYVSLDAEL